MIGRNSAPRPTPTKKNPLFQKCALIGWTGVAGLLIALLKFKRMDGLMMSSYKAPLCWDLHPHHYCDTLFPRKQHRSINYRQKKNNAGISWLASTTGCDIILGFIIIESWESPFLKSSTEKQQLAGKCWHFPFGLFWHLEVLSFSTCALRMLSQTPSLYELS